MADDGFREIQLNGKQLVFLFMATTIVAVVIFLCGVMVGRGVRNNTAALTPPGGSVAAPAPDTPPAESEAPARNAQAVLPEAPPTPPAEDPGSYAPSDAGKTQPEAVKKEPDATAPAAAAPAPAADAPAAPAADETARKPAASPAAGVGSEPGGEGFVVQVAALNEKGQAEAIASGLAAKGYAAYVMPPPPGGGMFRVRIGKFKERRQAETIVRRLKKEEKLEPWITR